MNELCEKSNIETEIPIIRISSFERYVLVILTILLLSNISIKLDIPIYRQVIGVFLLLLPGLLFVRLLNFVIKDTTEKLLLTFGICISILILIGVILIFISHTLGLDRPLSTDSLLLTYDFVCILLIGMSKKKFSAIIFNFSKNRLTPYDKLFLSLAFLIPGWSVGGAFLMNMYSYNTLLLVLFIFVSILIILVSIYHKKIASEIYPIIIFLISISLVMLYPMRSDHLLGVDVHLECYLYQDILNSLDWQLTSATTGYFHLLSPCGSVSLLPALFQSILQVNSETLYIYYIPCLFSITPIIVYIVAKHCLNNLEAFFASIAFISYDSFFTASYYSRATLAVLFFALFIMVLFNDSLFQYQKSILLLLFSFTIILTHYSSAYIFLYIFLVYSFFIYVMSKKLNFKSKLSISLVLTTIVFAFLWYAMITYGIFQSSVKFLQLVLNVDNFHDENAYSGTVSQLAGHLSNYFLSKFNFINSWLFLLFIGLGFVYLLLRFKQYFIKPNRMDGYVLQKKEFEPEFLIITVPCIVILVMTLVLPYLSNGYSLNRIYFQVSVILSIVFIVGGRCAAVLIIKIMSMLKISYTNKIKNNYIETGKLRYIAILIILIPHFLFTSQVLYELTGARDSIIFNSACSTHDQLYIHDSDASCSKWWSSHKMGSYNLWADSFGTYQIMDQGHIEGCDKITESESIPKNNYIYLRETNIAKNCIYCNYYETLTTEEFISKEYPLDKLYSSPAAILHRSNIGS